MFRSGCAMHAISIINFNNILFVFTKRSVKNLCLVDHAYSHMIA